MSKKKKIRADFRKNRSTRARPTDWTRQFDSDELSVDNTVRGERISGKGELSRRRTILSEDVEAEGENPSGTQLSVDESLCRTGRVLSVHGLYSEVQDADGVIYHCATRRILKTLATDQRHVVTAGDRVLFRPVETSDAKEGFIERVEPRQGMLCREVRERQQILVTNVDLVAIVSSAAEPRLKPNLIDRMLVAAEKGDIRPMICINKIDLVDAADLQPLVGVYSQMGYEVLLLSAKTGFGIDRLRRMLIGRSSVLAGQSGVGKSSLLNCVDPCAASARAGGQRRYRKRQTHDKHRPAVAVERRGICGRYARHSAIPALGRRARGNRQLFPRFAAVHEPVPLSQLHPYA